MLTCLHHLIPPRSLPRSLSVPLSAEGTDYLSGDLLGEVHAAQRSLKARLGAQRVQGGIHLQ
jgi:hypothetical protein